MKNVVRVRFFFVSSEGEDNRTAMSEEKEEEEEEAGEEEEEDFGRPFQQRVQKCTANGSKEEKGRNC